MANAGDPPPNTHRYAQKTPPPQNTHTYAQIYTCERTLRTHPRCSKMMNSPTRVQEDPPPQDTHTYAYIYRICIRYTHMRTLRTHLRGSKMMNSSRRFRNSGRKCLRTCMHIPVGVCVCVCVCVRARARMVVYGCVHGTCTPVPHFCCSYLCVGVRVDLSYADEYARAKIPAKLHDHLLDPGLVWGLVRGESSTT